MYVTLGQLRAFERIVRLGSFHAAAAELNLSQPSVSQRIRELEAALQTPLFVRRGPRVGLTAEGHALIEYATACCPPPTSSSTGSARAIR